jgi:Na+-transporting methylmalonyl-CoA/oxaloacetate decarboxylase gamma subunit
MHNVLCIPGFSILLVAPGYTLRFLGSVGVAIVLVFCALFVLMHNVLCMHRANTKTKQKQKQKTTETKKQKNNTENKNDDNTYTTKKPEGVPRYYQQLE